jgi:hypothetical protein
MTLKRQPASSHVLLRRQTLLHGAALTRATLRA